MQSSQSDEPSPRKRTKTDDDISTRWSAAADAMTDADAKANEGLSARLSRFSAGSSAGPIMGGHGRRRSVAKSEVIDLSTDTEESEADDGSDFSQSANPRKRRNSKAKPKAKKPKAKPKPPSAELLDDHEFDDSLAVDDSILPDIDDQDYMIDVPGELVYSRETRSKTEYWPAKVTGYVPPVKGSRKKKGKYKIIFFDGVEKSVDRDLFFADYESGFSTCKVRIDRSPCTTV